ncbi:MAG: hypothetical protein H0U32_01505 [Thermoleophilaceae bacterium]|nr:hypothetical protein [Thermoleophilaceae bacterium]
MSDTGSKTRRGPGERVLAWVFTGPLGHFYSVAVDLLVFAARSLAGRAQRWVLQLSGRRLSGEDGTRTAGR